MEIHPQPQGHGVFFLRSHKYAGEPAHWIRYITKTTSVTRYIVTNRFGHYHGFPVPSTRIRRVPRVEPLEPPEEVIPDEIVLPGEEI